MLQTEVNQAQADIEILVEEFAASQGLVSKYSALLTERSATDLFSAVKVAELVRIPENIAGVEAPAFGKIVF